LTPNSSPQTTDIGNVQEHTLSVFSVSVSQYWPAQHAGEADRVLHARLQVRSILSALLWASGSARRPDFHPALLSNS